MENNFAFTQSNYFDVKQNKPLYQYEENLNIVLLRTHWCLFPTLL